VLKVNLGELLEDLNSCHDLYTHGGMGIELHHIKFNSALSLLVHRPASVFFNALTTINQM